MRVISIVQEAWGDRATFAITQAEAKERVKETKKRFPNCTEGYMEGIAVKEVKLDGTIICESFYPIGN